MTIPVQLHQLVERFDKHLDDYKSGKYNETQVRREFIDPLFKALGWDVDNSQGYAEVKKQCSKSKLNTQIAKSIRWLEVYQMT